MDIGTKFGSIFPFRIVKCCHFYRAMPCASAVFAVVRPSLCVCPSVTFVYYIQTAEDIAKLLSPLGSPIILVFWLRAQIPNSKAPFIGALNTRWLGKFICDF